MQRLLHLPPDFEAIRSDADAGIAASHEDLRLVSGLIDGRGFAARNDDDPARFTAVAAGEDGGVSSGGVEALGQMGYDWGFSGASHRQGSYADDFGFKGFLFCWGDGKPETCPTAPEPG